MINHPKLGLIIWLEPFLALNLPKHSKV